MDEGQPVATKCRENTAYLVRHLTAAREITHRRRPATVCQRSSTVSCSWSGGNSGQSTNDGYHVTTVCRSGYYQLLQLLLCQINQSLMPIVAQTLVQTFISCRLDYCNSLLYGIANSQLRRLQSVQNAAARLMTDTQRTEHITPVLRSLHWLPIRQRSLFKLVVLVHKCLNGRAHAYLADDCRLIHCWQFGLRSSSSATKTGGPTDQNDAWRPIFCCRRTTCVEQSTDIHSRPVTDNRCFQQ